MTTTDRLLVAALQEAHAILAQPNLTEQQRTTALAKIRRSLALLRDAGLTVLA